MALVALAIVGVLAMAALSIDVGTLYQASAEAQRAADAAALAAAPVISLSGITGDPSNSTSSWQPVCGGASSSATLAAMNVAQQNLIGGNAASTVTVYYGTSGGATSTTCTGASSDFGFNPVVKVYVQQAKLPTFFARVFSLIPSGTSSNSGVSATAAAEAFNPSGSGTPKSSAMIPVQPRCVKPWIVPNRDPGNAIAPHNFVSPTDGSIVNKGVFQLGGGVIGETFLLGADCVPGAADCEVSTGHILNNPPQWISPGPPAYLQYVPALVQGTPSAAPSCANGNVYQEAIGGCDQTTVYTCGTSSATPGATQADLTENPVNPAATTGDTSTAAQCLIHQSAGGGEDIIDDAPGTFPFPIKAGDENLLVTNGLAKKDDVITASNSVATLPIADFSGGATLTGTQPAVTIVGFLQVFIKSVDTTTGNINVTVLNVAGCGNDAENPAVNGTSPVPVRLITPP